MIKYPSDEEDHGLYALTWRGPSCVTDLYSYTACTLLLKYFTENSICPLPRVFVEIEDPYASNVSAQLLFVLLRYYYSEHFRFPTMCMKIRNRRCT